MAVKDVKSIPDVEIEQDFYAIDILALDNKDPEYAYRWLNDKASNINVKTSNDPIQGGWKICDETDLKRLKLDNKAGQAADGLIRRGTLILAKMPKAKWEKKVAYKTFRAKKQLAETKELLDHGDPSAGAGTHPSLKGLQTQKQLKME